jgi:hypothetical protein
MLDFDFRYLLLIPFTLGEAFLLWALWQLHKQIKGRQDAKPRLKGTPPQDSSTPAASAKNSGQLSFPMRGGLRVPLT